MKKIILLIFIFIVYLFYFNNIAKYDNLDENEDLDNNNQNLINKENIEIYVINLKKRPERLEKIKERINNSDINDIKLNIFEAIDGSLLDPIDYLTDDAYKFHLKMKEDGKRTSWNQILNNEIGCTLSHINIYKKFLESDKEYAIIFEDDVTINQNIYKNAIENINQIFPNDWDIILLGMAKNYKYGKYEEYKKYKKVFHFAQSHAYIINKNNIQKIIDNSFPMYIRYEPYLSNLAKDKIINIYAINYLQSYQDRSFITDIQVNVEKFINYVKSYF